MPANLLTIGPKPHVLKQTIGSPTETASSTTVEVASIIEVKSMRSDSVINLFTYLLGTFPCQKHCTPMPPASAISCISRVTASDPAPHIWNSIFLLFNAIIDRRAIGNCLRKSNFPTHIIFNGSFALLSFLTRSEIISTPVSFIKILSL